MFKQHIIRGAARISLLGLIGLGVTLVDAQSSFATPAKCQGKCQANRMCADLVAQKNLKGAEQKTEYNKCTRDPMDYK